MARFIYQSNPPSRLPLISLGRWAPSLAIWGAGAGTAALFLLSVTPLVKKGFLVHVPVMGTYFEDKTPASDKPF